MPKRPFLSRLTALIDSQTEGVPALWLIAFYWLLPMTSFAQREAHTWYFGKNAGLDFSTNPPTTLTTGQINTREGVASISDRSTGQLLFYSEGTQVWNRNHQVMPNGSGLQGDYSSTQSSVVVPNPANASQYFLFTTALGKGVRYSVVDMALQGGLGDVVPATKNTLLLGNASSSEKLIAAAHCNKKDYWVITHSINSNSFYVYAVTAAGVQPAVIYNLGASIGDGSFWEATGYLKLSPDGSQLAHAIGPASIGALSNVEMLNFNNQSGQISGPVKVLNSLSFPYGVEFSQSGALLYVGELNGKRILQFETTASDINATRTVIANSANLSYGALQLGPDNRIYVSAENGGNIGYPYLGVINYPEWKGAACQYVQDAINLGAARTLIGLPTFSATFLKKDTATIHTVLRCAGNSSDFRLTNTQNVDSVKWDFGDGSDSSMSLAPAHGYSTAGVYPVKAIVYRSCQVNDTITKAVTVGNCTQHLVTASFIAPDTVCISKPVNIANTSTGASSYFWNFCVADISLMPQGINLGNTDGQLSVPVFMDYVLVNGNYYGFVVNHSPGGLVRLNFGNSLLNIPTAVNLGNFGGSLPVNWGSEGIRVVQNEGKWYAIIVGGTMTSGNMPRVVKIDFGTDITNPAPTATNWGNLGNMEEPVDLDLFQENNEWYGFTVNAVNNTVTRFRFGNSFDNMPVGENLGNLGNLSYPTGLYIINDNGTYRVFVINELSGGSITRLDFGNSLLNTPTATNIGNPGNALIRPRDISIMRSCGQAVAFATNGPAGNNTLVKLDFNGDLTSTPTAVPLGNFANFNLPHSISKLFRVKEDIYGFITNAYNNTISRIRFPGCTNASIPNSTAYTPPAVTYNTPGTYNINLTIDDGLPTQTAYCKQVVVLPAPVPAPTKQIALCKNGTVKIGTNKTNVTYLWSTGATTDSIVTNAPGTYWVEVNSFGCKATDAIKVFIDEISDFGFKQEVCDPLRFQFFNTGAANAAPWWDMGDGTIVTGNTTPRHTFATYGDYTVRFSVSNGVCTDTVTKLIPVRLLKENVVLTNDTVICDGTTKQLRAVPALSYCWYPATNLNDPAAQYPVTNTTQDITYYLNTAVAGNNLIVNGDFSAGNTGFSSEYIYTTINVTEGEYGVGADPKAWNPQCSNCRDHSSGNGNMLLVNGNPVVGAKVWEQQVTVTPNTNYAFSTWIQSISEQNPAQLLFAINGRQMAGTIAATLPGCNWIQFYTTWNSGNTTTAAISVVNINTIRAGNDFALDDISFAPIFIKHDSVVVKVEKPLVRTNKDTTVCLQKTVPLVATGAATYSWLPATGLSNPHIVNPVATVQAPTEYIVTGTTLNGCIARDTVLLDVFARPAIARTPDTAVCRNTRFPLYVSGGSSYEWAPAGGMSDVYTNQPVVSVGTEDVVFGVTITDQYNCQYQDAVKVAIHPYPVFAATGNKAICAGDALPLKASGGDVYQWLPAHFVDDAASPTPLVNPDMTMQFSVHIQENTCGFDTTIHLPVRVDPLPVVTITKPHEVNCNTPTVQLQAAGALQYSWTPAMGLDNPYKPNPIVAIDSTREYTVRGVNSFGCSATAYVEVKVTKDGIPRFTAPNAFTPNGDGNNDCFGIRRWGATKLEELAVYNRWGQLIFRTTDPAHCWDGTFKGKPQEAGGYVYVIRGRTICGQVSQKGVIMLVR